jgi:hypothetical protein
MFFWNAAHLLCLNNFDVVLVYSKSDATRIPELYQLLKYCNHRIRIKHSRLISGYFNNLDKLTQINSTFVHFIIGKLNTYTTENLSAEFLHELRQRSIIRGFFQDWELVNSTLLNYISEVSESILELTEQSELLKELNSVSDLQVIHARRGDYLQIKEKIGVVTIDSQLLMTNKKLPLAVCTDSRDHIINSELKNLKITVYGTEELNAWQSLALMSKAKVLVCGNSTLSWWAARIQDKNNCISYLPDRWSIDAQYQFAKLADPNYPTFQAIFEVEF